MSKIRLKYLLSLLFFYVISRIVLLSFVGIRFEYDWVFQMWQFIDIELLKSKLLESVYYFHYQPPVFNLFLGAIHKQSLFSPKVILQLFFYSLTFFMGCLIFVLSKTAGNKDRFSFFFTFLFYLFPETIIYENWPIYTWTSSFLLVFGFYCLDCYKKSRDSKSLHLFFFSQLILILTRSAFHPIFYVTWFLYLLFIIQEDRKNILKTFLIYFSIFVIISMKNLLEFGFFGLGSGLGFSLYKIAPKITFEKQVMEELEIDPVFKIGPVRSITTYGFNKKEVPAKYKSIDVLNKEFKSTLGPFTEEFSVNLGHYHYMEIANKYKKSAIRMIKSYPLEYMRRVFRGIIMFFKPTWDHGFGVTENAKSLEKMINFFTLHNFRMSLEDIFIKRDKPWPLRSEIPYSSYIVIPILYILILIFMWQFKLLRFENIQYMFVFYTVVYLFVVSNLIELAENDRYRVMIDPLVYLTGVLLLPKLINRKNV